MKLLRIEDSRGQFLLRDGSYAEIDKITKEELLRLVDLTLTEDIIEYDEYSDELVKNQAHQIVYKSVYEKLSGLRSRRKEFVDESERIYLADYERYRPRQEAAEEAAG